MDGIEKAIEIIENKAKDVNYYYKIYPFSTENIKGYLDYFDLYNKSLLTIGSSGDQVLNSYYNGCRDITLLDINPFCKYYLNLKIAGIISLSYEEFVYFFFPKINNKNNRAYFHFDLFKKLAVVLKEIDLESYTFFDRKISVKCCREV